MSKGKGKNGKDSGTAKNVMNKNGGTITEMEKNIETIC